MPKSFSAELGAWKASVERRLDNLSSGSRLDHASLDGTTLYLKGDGELGRIGRQPDGSMGVHVAKVQPPPQLTAPILTVGEQAGTCLVEWDGNTFDGRRMPLIHGHTEIWAELVDEDWSPTVAPGGTAKRVGTIRDRTGGEVVVALPQAGVWAVWLRAMGADRETAGPWSPVSQVEISPLVDTDAIEAELDEARDRLEQAEQDLAAGMAERVSEIEHLREVRIPALQDALTTGLDDVYRDAEALAEAARDDAVNQAASNAQTEYDRLQEIAERALSRAGDNVLEDPSFETDYWFDYFEDIGDRPYTPTSVHRTGIQALEIGEGRGFWLNFDSLDVEEGESWRFMLWYRTSGEPSMGVTSIAVRDEVGGAQLERSEYFHVSEGEFTRAVITYTVPPGVTQLVPGLLPDTRGGTLIIDDVSFQEVGAAAEALRLAEVARQQAEAAHVAAGVAADNAAGAYAAAAGKSTIHWSLSAPSGTADNGDVWWRYELRSGRRTVVGEWVRENNTWRETDIAEERIPLLDIGTATYGTMSGDRLKANTVETRHLLVGPQNLISDTEFSSLGSDDPLAWNSYHDSDAWYVTEPTGWATSPILRLSDSFLGDGFYSVAYGGTGSNASIPCTPGETFKVRFQAVRYSGWSSDDDFRLQVRWYTYDGAHIAWTRLDFGNYSDGSWVDEEITAPEGAAYFFVRFHKSGVAASARGVTNLSIKSMTDTSLIVQGAVKSHSVDTEEFFSAVAVIEAIWTDIVRSRLIQSEGIITEDMIATGAVTTPKLTVTEEMVGEVARLLRIEAGSLASNDITAMRIVSSLIEATTYLIHNADGDVSVRLDGMDNYLAGRLHAGMSEDTGIGLDYRLTEVPDGWEDDNEEGGDTAQFVTPEIAFHSNHNHEHQPGIWVRPDGNLSLDPGMVTGGTAAQRELHIWGRARTQRITAVRHEVPTSNPSTPGGMFRDGDRVRLYGRSPDWSHVWGTFTPGSLGPYSPVSGQYRGTMTWSTPTVTGVRNPIVTGRMSQTSINNWRSCTATTRVGDASGFEFTLVSSSTSTNMWLDYLANWI